MLRIIASQIGHRDINTVGLYRTFLPCLQCVRWKRRPYVRKPLYLGTAKSKLLKFPQWHPYGPGEFEELHKLYNDYKHAFKSICQYYKDEQAKISETSHLAAQMHKEEQEEHERLMEINRLENERIAKLRSVRIAEEVKRKQETLMHSLAAREVERKKHIEEAEEVIRQTKKLVQTFITMETLDAALDKAMETEVDYNFAIDLDGNVYRGDTAKPERVGRMSHKESVVNT